MYILVYQKKQKNSTNLKKNMSMIFENVPKIFKHKP